MTRSALPELIIAGCTVLGTIGSVLLLAYRTGRLVGMLQGHIAGCERDRGELHRQLGRESDRLSRHLERHGRSTA